MYIYIIFTAYSQRERERMRMKEKRIVFDGYSANKLEFAIYNNQQYMGDFATKQKWVVTIESAVPCMLND